MLKISYHNHTNYSDGIDTPEAMAAEAYRAGYTHFAISDHIYSADYPDWTVNPEGYRSYVKHIGRIKQEYAGKMQLFIGIEADWYKNQGTAFTEYELLEPMIDFTVGSIHVLNPGGKRYLIDGSIDFYTTCLEEAYGGSIEKMITDYYETYLQMANGLKPNLLGHIDIMRKNNPDNRFFDERDAWVINLQETAAKEIKKLDLVTEINGGGAYRYQNNVVYPSEQFLHILKDEGVKLTIGLDAHSVEMVDSYYQDSLNLAKKIGFHELHYFENGNWIAAPIEHFSSVSRNA